MALAEETQEVKCVVVGDAAAEKTSLLASYMAIKYPEESHIPKVFDNYTAMVACGGELYKFSLFDTTGQDDYDRLRPLSYPQTDVFLVCFSVVEPLSFENVSGKWFPEITHHCPRTPFLLVGTQIHLRDDPQTMTRLAGDNQKLISPKQGKKLAKKLRAVKYVECSALTRQGVKQVFDEAILAALEPLRPLPSPETSHRCRVS